MRGTFFCLAVAAGATAAKSTTSSNGPLVTFDGFVELTTQSLTLGKSILGYAGGIVYKGISDQVPMEHQKAISDLYGEAYSQVEKQRKDLGVPSYTELTALVSKQLYPQLEKAKDSARKVLFPVEQVSGAMIASFEKANPESAGLLPKDIFDLMFCAFYLLLLAVYVVLPVVWFFLGGILCCGMCSKRNSNYPATPKKNEGKTAASNGKTDLKAKKQK